MKNFSGFAVPRYQVFTLNDGTFVVQWDDVQVQELLTGLYREFDLDRDFGQAITDYELAQLRTSGRVEHFDRHYVWLYPLPQAGQFGKRRITVDTESDALSSALAAPHPALTAKPTTAETALLVVNRPDETNAFAELLASMDLEVVIAEGGTQALQLLEDNVIRLMVMDIQLPDMHGWQFIAKARELAVLGDLSIIVLTDQRNLNTPVARVEYLLRPVSIAKLRTSITTMLATNTNPPE